MQDFSLTYTFFRGSKSQMTGQKILEPSQMTVSVTVVQAGKPDIILKCPGMFLISITFQLLEFFLSPILIGSSVSLNSFELPVISIDTLNEVSPYHYI